MIDKIISKIIDKKNLSADESAAIIDCFANNSADENQISIILKGFNEKGVTAEELTGMACKMRQLAVQIPIEKGEIITDSCGTGGDEANTFNISTASAIIAASSGLMVAKHSNSGFTSKCGSSNVTSALGIKLADTPEKASKQLKENNITFLHAPYFHNSTKSVGAVRKKLGIRTVFNYLGPLTNPTKPTGQVIGVSNVKMAPIIIETLKNLGCKKALVATGHDPLLDEISICGRTSIYKLENNRIESFDIFPEDFGIKTSNIKEISGKDPEFNASLIKDIFSGNIQGPKLDVLAINTAALLWSGNIVDSIESGIKMSYELVQSGKAAEKLALLQQ